MLRKEAYDVSSTWETYYSSLKKLPRRLKKPASFVVETLPTFKSCRFKRVLDLGCGTGRHCVPLAKKGFEVVGVDVSKSALRLANKWVQKERLTSVTFVRGTMTNIPFATHHFDAVISVSVIHHALKKDIVNTIMEIHRILRKSGVFLANLASVKDPRFGSGTKVEENTFKVLEAFEERRFEELHHYSTKQEVSQILAAFTKTEIELMEDKPHYWKITAIK